MCQRICGKSAARPRIARSKASGNQTAKSSDAPVLSTKTTGCAAPESGYDGDTMFIFVRTVFYTHDSSRHPEVDHHVPI